MTLVRREFDRSDEILLSTEHIAKFATSSRCKKGNQKTVSFLFFTILQALGHLFNDTTQYSPMAEDEQNNTNIEDEASDREMKITSEAEK